MPRVTRSRSFVRCSAIVYLLGFSETSLFVPKESNCHCILLLYLRKVPACSTVTALSAGSWTRPLVPDVFLCISLRSNSALLPVYCWPCNFVYDVFVAGGFSCTLYSDSGSPSPFLFMVITREHFILALGERLLCFFVWACMLALESVFFEVRAFVKWSEKFVEPQLAIKIFCVCVFV